MTLREQVSGLLPVLREARRVLFMTGAGVSVESGIPSFRGSTAAFKDGLTEEGIPFEVALSGPAFKRDPERTWQYFFRLEQALRGKKPNAAHLAMATLEQRGFQVCIATQNIDGLHQSAGSRRVIELHGNLRRVVCRPCGYLSSPETFETLPPLPRCPQCSRILRPDAVLYEEMLPPEALEEFETEQKQGFDLVFFVGTTAVFDYILAPAFAASHRGVPTVEINPEETPLSEIVTYRFAAPAGLVMQEVLQCL